MIVKNLRPAIVSLIIFTVLLGGVYPAVSTVIIQNLFPEQSTGSLIKDKNGNVLGSELIGQNFSKPEYFWGRISATSPAYNAAASTGTNYGSNNPKLLEAVNARIAELQKYKHEDIKIPVDLVTASGSGLDPHISIAAAKYQIPRIADVRNMDGKQVAELVKKYTDNRQLGFLGEPRVNVLKLNLALDGKI